MKYKQFKTRILDHLVKYKEDTLGVLEYGTYPQNGQAYPHILPECSRHKNFLPTVKKPPELKEHLCSHHLNSSQIVCINFFEPLLDKAQGNSLLLRLLKEETGFVWTSGARIHRTEFEFMPWKTERTSFDFYLELSGGERIFFEIKYTEPSFGAIHSTKNDPDRYERRWRELYSPHLENSLYLKSLTKDAFYSHYQIWRNVSYIRADTEYVIFILPYENEGLYQEVLRALYSVSTQLQKNVAALNWRSLVSSALDLSRNTDYHRHFALFAEKYFPNIWGDGS